MEAPYRKRATSPTNGIGSVWRRGNAVNRSIAIAAEGDPLLANLSAAPLSLIGGRHDDESGVSTLCQQHQKLGRTIRRGGGVATMIGPDHLISISHSHGGGDDAFGTGGSGVVTVWYWEQT
jgi:hypothetical protein